MFFRGAKLAKKLQKIIIKLKIDVHFVFKHKKNLSGIVNFCYFAPQKGNPAFVKVKKGKNYNLKWHLT